MQADSKSYDDINVTPMVDLYLVFLLIFIIMTTAGVQVIKVNLPRASTAPARKSTIQRNRRAPPTTRRIGLSSPSVLARDAELGTPDLSGPDRHHLGSGGLARVFLSPTQESNRH